MLQSLQSFYEVAEEYKQSIKVVDSSLCSYSDKPEENADFEGSAGSKLSRLINESRCNFFLKGVLIVLT